MNAALIQLLSRTAQGRLIVSKLQKSKLAGEDPDFLGKAKKKKAKKPGKNIFQKIGKYTSKVTGPVANMAARIVGIPPDTMNALAKMDPTAHKALTKTLIQSKAGEQAAAALEQSQKTGTNIFKNIKPVYIAGGAAGIAVIIFLATKKKK
jgi:hypothetical protein